MSLVTDEQLCKEQKSWRKQIKLYNNKCEKGAEDIKKEKVRFA